MSCTVHCLLWLQNMRRSVNPRAGDSDDDDEEEEEGYQSELQTVLESMTRRMIKSELEDFELVCIRTSPHFTKVIMHSSTSCSFQICGLLFNSDKSRAIFP